MPTNRESTTNSNPSNRFGAYLVFPLAEELSPSEKSIFQTLGYKSLGATGLEQSSIASESSMNKALHGEDGTSVGDDLTETSLDEALRAAGFKDMGSVNDAIATERGQLLQAVDNDMARLHEMFEEVNHLVSSQSDNIEKISINCSGAEETTIRGLIANLKAAAYQIEGSWFYQLCDWFTGSPPPEDVAQIEAYHDRAKQLHEQLREDNSLLAYLGKIGQELMNDIEEFLACTEKLVTQSAQAQNTRIKQVVVEWLSRVSRSSRTASGATSKASQHTPDFASFKASILALQSKEYHQRLFVQQLATPLVRFVRVDSMQDWNTFKEVALAQNFEFQAEAAPNKDTIFPIVLEKTDADSQDADSQLEIFSISTLNEFKASRTDQEQDQELENKANLLALRHPELPHNFFRHGVMMHLSQENYKNMRFRYATLVEQNETGSTVEDARRKLGSKLAKNKEIRQFNETIIDKNNEIREKNRARENFGSNWKNKRLGSIVGFFYRCVYWQRQEVQPRDEVTLNAQEKLVQAYDQCNQEELDRLIGESFEKFGKKQNQDVKRAFESGYDDLRKSYVDELKKKHVLGEECKQDAKRIQVNLNNIFENCCGDQISTQEQAWNQELENISSGYPAEKADMLRFYFDPKFKRASSQEGSDRLLTFAELQAAKSEEIKTQATKLVTFYLRSLKSFASLPLPRSAKPSAKSSVEVHPSNASPESGVGVRAEVQRQWEELQQTSRGYRFTSNTCYRATGEDSGMCTLQQAAADKLTQDSDRLEVLLKKSANEDELTPEDKIEWASLQRQFNAYNESFREEYVASLQGADGAAATSASLHYSKVFDHNNKVRGLDTVINHKLGNAFGEGVVRQPVKPAVAELESFFTSYAPCLLTAKKTDADFMREYIGVYSKLDSTRKSSLLPMPGAAIKPPMSESARQREALVALVDALYQGGKYQPIRDFASGLSSADLGKLASLVNASGSEKSMKINTFKSYGKALCLYVLLNYSQAVKQGDLGCPIAGFEGGLSLREVLTRNASTGGVRTKLLEQISNLSPRTNSRVSSVANNSSALFSSDAFMASSIAAGLAAAASEQSRQSDGPDSQGQQPRGVVNSNSVCASQKPGPGGMMRRVAIDVHAILSCKLSVCVKKVGYAIINLLGLGKCYA